MATRRKDSNDLDTPGQSSEVMALERSSQQVVASGPPDICIVGGAGHIGLPLALVFASRGRKVAVYDTNEAAIDSIRNGKMPFMEANGETLLQNALRQKRLVFATGPESVLGVPIIIITIGTPVDEFLNPALKPITKCLDDLLP